jgi:1-acyl-sn-glycerol-3-phosphate acyltransferase
VIIAAVRSLATYIAVSVYVLFAAPIGMLLDMVFGWKGILYIFGHGGVRLGLALCGIKVHVAGAANIPLDRAAVYCANHQSNVDPPILFDKLHPRMHIVYKAEINAIPLLARRVPPWRLRAESSAATRKRRCARSRRARAPSRPATRS